MISNKRFRVKKNGEPYNDCYCTKPELIENYNLAIADKNRTWECHHKMEKYFPQKTLKAIGWYYDCEPTELIFLIPEEHRSLDQKGNPGRHKGKAHSEETKQKMSEAHKDKCHHNKGKHWKLVDGQRVWY